MSQDLNQDGSQDLKNPQVGDEEWGVRIKDRFDGFKVVACRDAIDAEQCAIMYKTKYLLVTVLFRGKKWMVGGHISLSKATNGAETMAGPRAMSAAVGKR